MTITAKIIADSISPDGIRLTTFQLKYPRFIHSEFMTHRVFSRNASSSRAIPVAKMIEAVAKDPAMPIHWGKNIPGMQAKEELTGQDREIAIREWKWSAARAVQHARRLDSLGLHKQVVNRILEPFQHISVVCTAINDAYANFFSLRYHPDAQPEIQELAKVMYEAMEANEPELLQPGQWHLPYVDATLGSEDWHSALVAAKGDSKLTPSPMAISEVLKKVSAARCCRVSYNKHDGTKANLEEDLKLCERLIGSVPLHASPFEHQATPDTEQFSYEIGHYWDEEWLHGNLRGWRQYRKMLANEYVTEFKKVENG